MAKIPDDLERRIKLIEEASKSVEAYNKLLDETRQLSENIAHIDETRAKINEKLLDAKAELRAYEEGFITLTKKQVAEAKKAVAAWGLALKTEEDLLATAREELRIRQEALSQVNKLNLTLKETVNITKKLGKQVLAQTGYFYEQQKAVKQTELSMGILSNQSNGFRNNIYKTSIATNQIGVSTKDLAELQGTYSDSIGRSVQLSEDQLMAMSELAKGTMLGVEGAAEFAANMESFGISARGSAEYIEEVLDTSNTLGVNSNKVIKNIQSNIKLLNKYNFKGGVKGLGKMAALATKFKFEMSSIASFAENLISPEGAVETAAKLQVLGGEWAKLGDPFELMYKSRNDIGGLTEDIIAATTATARFDKTTGEVRIDPMEMQRLREVANATGLEYDSLAESARAAAKFTQIESGMSSLFSKEDKTLLSSMAQWNDKTKEFEITMQNEDGKSVTENVNALKQITPALVESQRKFSEGLKERAMQAQTFDDTWENLKNTIKTLLFPGFEAFTLALQNSVGDFHKWATDTGAFDTLADVGKTLGEFAAVLIKFASNNPIATGVALLVGKAAIWYARGVSLGLGFNSVAGGTGGASGKGLGGKLFGQMAKGGGAKGLVSNMKTGGRSMGAIGGGVLSAGISGYDEWSENSENGMGSGENVARTIARGAGSGLGAWGGAAAGAAIGTAILPVIGTLIGGIIGGIGGGMLGDAAGDAAGDLFGGSNSQSPQLNDFISRPGENAVSISSDDTLIGAKKGGPIDKMLEDNKGGNASGGKVSVEFSQPLRIEGRLELSNNGNQVNIPLDDPILMRDLAKMIQIELSKAISGGKIGSNPVQFA